MADVVSDTIFINHIQESIQDELSDVAFYAGIANESPDDIARLIITSIVGDEYAHARTQAALLHQVNPDSGPPDDAAAQYGLPGRYPRSYCGRDEHRGAVCRARSGGPHTHHPVSLDLYHGGRVWAHSHVVCATAKSQRLMRAASGGFHCTTSPTSSPGRNVRRAQGVFGLKTNPFAERLPRKPFVLVYSPISKVRNVGAARKSPSSDTRSVPPQRQDALPTTRRALDIAANPGAASPAIGVREMCLGDGQGQRSCGVSLYMVSASPCSALAIHHDVHTYESRSCCHTQIFSNTRRMLPPATFTISSSL